MADTDLHGMIASRLESIEASLREVAGSIGELKTAMHLPADCPAITSLNTRINRLELAEARRGGMLAVVGVLAGLVAGGIITVLTRLVPWR